MPSPQPIDLEKLRFDPKLSHWRYVGSEAELEFILAGNEAGPSARALAMAGMVLGDISKYEVMAIDYLKRKLAGAEALRDNAWYLEWVEFGIGERREFEEFELFLIETHDPYALWSVRFRMRSKEVHPLSVTRADW